MKQFLSVLLVLLVVGCGGEESPFLSRKESQKLDSIHAKQRSDEMAAYTDSVIKAHSWRIDSAIYYFTRNHECYYKALQYGREGRKKLLDIYSDSTEYYNNQLQKLAK